MTLRTSVRLMHLSIVRLKLTASPPQVHLRYLGLKHCCQLDLHEHITNISKTDTEPQQIDQPNPMTIPPSPPKNNSLLRMSAPILLVYTHVASHPCL